MSINTNLEPTLELDTPPPAQQDTFSISHRKQRQLAVQDIRDGLAKFRIWVMLAYQDVKLRYRRSVIGPFWLTLSMAITTYSMGFLYSHLFHIDLQNYFPFLVAGMLSWALISGLMSELLETFTSAEEMIKQIKLPYSLYIHRVTTRNIIVFFHNLLVIVPIIAIFHQVAKVNIYTLLLLPGLAVMYVNAIAYGLILAMLGARYRDLVPIIRSLIQVAFFITPVMWNPVVLPAKYKYVTALNPFYAFVELIRSPLIGATISLSTLVMVTFVTCIGITASFLMFKKYRARIVYWL